MNMFDLDKIKLRHGYILVCVQFGSMWGKVLKVGYSYEHLLDKEVIVNTKPSDVAVINDTNTGEAYILCSHTRIVVTKI